MINTIFSSEDLTDTPVDTVNVFKRVSHYITKVPESRRVSNRYLNQATILNIHVLNQIKAILEALGKTPDVIGIWYVNTGFQYGYYMNNAVITRDNEIIIDYPFNIAEYANYLNDIVQYDENDNEISRKRPTLTEARNIQINKFYGVPDRDLNTY